MPNTREKLIEFICSVEYGNGSLVGNNFQRGFIEKIADHLIANGVTIPVRCKECYFGKGEIICTNPKCTKSFYGCPVPPDHFCSHGERRNKE